MFVCMCMYVCAYAHIRVCVDIFCASTQTHSMSAFEQEWCTSVKEAGRAWEEGPGWLVAGTPLCLPSPRK